MDQQPTNINQEPETASPYANEPASPNQSTNKTAMPTSPDYVSNPFTVGFRHLAQAVTTNPVPVLLSFVVPILLLFAASIVLVVPFAILNVKALAILMMVLICIIAIPFLTAVTLVVAKRSSQRETITTKQAINQAVEYTPKMLGLVILLMIVVTLGFVALIIPGFILLVKLSLAPVVLFYEDLGVMQALKRSWNLTTGHFFEVLGALFAGNFLYYGGGLISNYGQVTQLVGRYEDIKKLEQTKQVKPETHWLNYLLPILTIVMVVVFMAISMTADQTTRRSGGSPKDSSLKYNYDF